MLGGLGASVGLNLTASTHLHTTLVNELTSNINTFLSADHTYTVVSVKEQVAADANYEFTLVTEDGRHVLAKVFNSSPHINASAEVKSAVYVN